VLPARDARVRAARPSPRWYAPLMVALMLFGLLWIVVYYVAADRIPFLVSLMVIGLLWIVTYYVAGDRIPFMVSLSAWNFAIGFGAMVAGLVMSMRWR